MTLQMVNAPACAHAFVLDYAAELVRGKVLQPCIAGTGRASVFTSKASMQLQALMAMEFTKTCATPSHSSTITST